MKYKVIHIMMIKMNQFTFNIFFWVSEWTKHSITTILRLRTKFCSINIFLIQLFILIMWFTTTITIWTFFNFIWAHFSLIISSCSSQIVFWMKVRTLLLIMFTLSLAWSYFKYWEIEIKTWTLILLTSSFTLSHFFQLT